MQLNLFDATPKSRPSDPSTSHDGAAWVEPQLNHLQREMWLAFQTFDVAKTANEAAAICVKTAGGCHESYRKRKGELQRMGLIEYVGKRRCGVTGRPAEVFRVRGGK